MSSRNLDNFIPDSCPKLENWCKRKLEYLEKNSVRPRSKSRTINDTISNVETPHSPEEPSWTDLEELYVVVSDEVEQKNPGSLCHLCNDKLFISFNPELESWVFTNSLCYGDSIVVHCKCFECVFGQRLRKMSF